MPPQDRHCQSWPHASLCACVSCMKLSTSGACQAVLSAPSRNIGPNCATYRPGARELPVRGATCNLIPSQSHPLLSHGYAGSTQQQQHTLEATAVFHSQAKELLPAASTSSSRSLAGKYVCLRLQQSQCMWYPCRHATPNFKGGRGGFLSDCQVAIVCWPPQHVVRASTGWAPSPPVERELAGPARHSA